MRKLLFTLIILFALESQAGDSGGLGLDEEVNNAGKMLLVVGGIAFLVAYSSNTNSFNGEENVYFDESTNAIKFSKETGFSNLEINFSNNRRQVFNNNLSQPDDMYLGLTFRF